MGNFFLLKGRSSTVSLVAGGCVCVMYSEMGLMFVYVCIVVSSFQTHCWRSGHLWTSGDKLFREGRRRDEGDCTLR